MSLIPHGCITGVEFKLTSSNNRKSHIIKKSTLYTNDNIPDDDGVLSPYLGTTESHYDCKTCMNDKKTCLGHEGSIKLNVPVFHPVFIQEIIKWLQITCHKCGNCLVKERKFYSTKVTEQILLCKVCNYTNHIIKKVRGETLGIEIAKLYNALPEKINEKPRIMPYYARMVFEKIKDETVLYFNKPLNLHPKNFIISVLSVPSVNVRPDIRKTGGGRMSNDNITSSLQKVINDNEKMSLEKSDYSKTYAFCATIYDMVKARAGSNSFSERIKGKKGLLRCNIQGRRTHNVARSTIVGDISLKLTEVGVPIYISEIVYVEEIVNPNNIKRLMSYKTNTYPKIKIVKKIKNNRKYDPSAIDVLEMGDTIQRDIIDGDYVLFNRQPSLMFSNITALRVVVIKDKNINTLRINSSLCKLFGADFDGDEMNLFVCAGEIERYEIETLSSVQNMLISFGSGKPSLGQTEDSIVGLTNMTIGNVTLLKHKAAQLFSRSNNIPLLENKNYSGREILSLALQETPINYVSTPGWYNPIMNPVMNYIDIEKKLQIKNGIMLSGVFDSQSIGSKGSLYHNINSEYGSDKTLNIIYEMQQIAIKYNDLVGHSIGLFDILLNKDARINIKTLNSEMILKVQHETNLLINGQYIPPIGKTIGEFYNEKVSEILKVGDDFIYPIMLSIKKDNGLLKLIMCGSKGSFQQHLQPMMGVVGQQFVNGKRLQETFSHNRTLPYFRRNETHPYSKGFIGDCFLEGITPAAYFANAQVSRSSIIAKALSTSVTGEQNRDAIKTLESTITTNLFASKKGNKYVQFAYGDNFIDPRCCEYVKFHGVLASDDEFKEKFFNQKYPEFYKAQLSDRQLYRKVFLYIESLNLREIISDKRLMPVNIERCINNLNNLPNSSNLGTNNLDENVKFIEKLCEEVPYWLFNKNQETKKMPIPAYVKAATWLVTMLIRCNLHPNNLQNFTIDNLVRISDYLKIKYRKSLISPGTAVGVIAAQSFSEPLTQGNLSAHRGSTGTTTKSTMVKAKEILGAKDTTGNKSSMIVSIYDTDEKKVKEMANLIEMVRFKQFVTTWQIFYEPVLDPIHPDYKSDLQWIKEYLKLNPLIQVPSLTRWCLRITLDKTTLILKNISIETIVNKLRTKYPYIFIVFTPENANKLYIRIYFQPYVFKSRATQVAVSNQKDLILFTIIRGVKDITNATPFKLLRSELLKNGEIKIGGSDSDSNNAVYGISTIGTNIKSILEYKAIDPKKIITDCILDTARYFGIEAARNRIISEMKGIVDSCAYSHLSIYADEMTLTGKVTNIKSSGLKSREPTNILLRMGYSNPMAAIKDGVMYNIKEDVYGITAPIILGDVPKIGTLYNSVQINKEFVKENVKPITDEDILNNI